MKKSILALSLLVGLSAAASSYAALPETVRIGTDTTYAPFSSKDAKGDFVGFDIDLGNEMCKRMQVKCTWVASDFDALIPSLKAKKKSTPLFRRFPLPINVSRRLLSPTSCTPQILV